jgi:hypothetical protein
MEKVFKGDFFIIPNSFEKYKSDSKNPWYGRFTKEMENFGITLQEGEYLVQIWATGSGSDNWGCHGNMELNKFLFPEQSFQKALEALEELKKSRILSEDEYENKLEEAEKLLPRFRFPGYLPLKVMENLNEGESICLTVNGKKIELTAKQLAYRYRNFGSFQAVIQKVRRASDKLYEQIEKDEVLSTLF